MKKRLDIVQSSTEPSKEVLWMTDGTLSYWGNNGWAEVNSSHNEIPSSGKDGQYLRYGKNGLEWSSIDTPSIDVPTKTSQLTNDSGFVSEETVTSKLENYVLKDDTIPVISPEADSELYQIVSNTVTALNYSSNKWESSINVDGYTNAKAILDYPKIGMIQRGGGNYVFYSYDGTVPGLVIDLFGGNILPSSIKSVRLLFNLNSHFAMLTPVWNVNRQPNWSTSESSDASFIKNKPTKLSQFTNDKNFITSTDVTEATKDLATKDSVTEELAKKVDKVEGKGLSSNDYTDEDKAKLDSVEKGANNTVVDNALSSTSTNPVANKVIKAAIPTKISQLDNDKNFAQWTDGLSGPINVRTLSADNVSDDDIEAYNFFKEIIDATLKYYDTNDSTVDHYDFNSSKSDCSVRIDLSSAVNYATIYQNTIDLVGNQASIVALTYSDGYALSVPVIIHLAKNFFTITPLGAESRSSKVTDAYPYRVDVYVSSGKVTYVTAYIYLPFTSITGIPDDILGISNTTAYRNKFCTARGLIYALKNVLGKIPKTTQITLTDAQTVSVSCESSKLYSGSSLTSLTITAAKTDSSQNGAEEVFQFSTGTTAPTITITGVSWANGDTPAFAASKTYEIHIMYNSTLGKFLATYATYD